MTYWTTTWRIFEYDNYIGIWPNEGVGRSNGYAPMAKVTGDKRWVTPEKRREIAELMASAPDLKKENEKLREELEDMHRRERSTAIQNLGNEGQLCDQIDRLVKALKEVDKAITAWMPEHSPMRNVLQSFIHAALQQKESE